MTINLKEVVQALPDLYPPIRTRSGRLIKTTELERPTKDELQAHPDLGEQADRHGLVIKTLFPTAARKRTPVTITLYQEQRHGAPHWALLVHPVERVGMADALRCAQLLKPRLADRLNIAIEPTKTIKTALGPALSLVTDQPVQAPPKAQRRASVSKDASPAVQDIPALSAPTPATATANGERS